MAKLTFPLTRGLTKIDKSSFSLTNVAKILGDLYVGSIFDTAQLDLSNLYYSAIPVRGAVTPSFTRATGKTIRNNDGYMVTILAGELGFPGARRVANLWGTASSTLLSGANVSMTLPAGAYQFSMGIGAGTATFSGTGGATGTLDANVIGRVKVAKTITAGTLVVTASVADLVDLQVVSMVAETDQTTIREYVSVGVASSPAYHGSMVDAVQCFPYALDGSRLTGMTTPLIELAATNLCLRSNAFATAPWATTLGVLSQNATGIDGATSAWTCTDNSAIVTQTLQQLNITLTAATHTIFFHIKKTSGVTAFPVLQVFDGGTRVAGCTINPNTGVATVWTSYTGLTVQTSSAVCESYDTDFWKVSLTFLATVAATWQINAYAAYTSNSTSANGATIDATQQGTQVFTKVQLELGTAGTSYIETGATAVARNKDEFLYTGALLGTLKSLAVLDFKRESGFANAGIIVAQSDGTSANIRQVYLGNATQTTFQGVASSVTQWQTDASNAYSAGTLSSVAWSAATNDIKMAKDGVAQTPDTVATIPTVDRLEYGMVAGALQLNGYPGIPYGWVRLESQAELNAETA